MKEARSVGILLALLTAFLLVSPTVLGATTYPLTLTVIGADNKALASATVKIYWPNGTFIASNVTDSTGKTSFALPVANTTYLVVVSSAYYALGTIFYNNKAPSMTFNVSQFVYANITSKVTNALSGTSVTINANVSLGDAPKYVLTSATNFTVYVPSGKNITAVFPNSVVAFPFKYTLTNLTYITTKVTGNSVTFVPAKTVVLATYSQSFYLTLEYWVAIAIVGIIVVAIVLAWFMGGRKTAQHIIEEHEEKARKFVHRKASELSKFVSTVEKPSTTEEGKEFIKEKKFVKRSE
ncbi:MAG: hypothetical protein ACP5IT_12115 [Thermoproteota archaeon]